MPLSVLPRRRVQTSAPEGLGIFGHAARRAIKARSMSRPEWRALTQRLRATSRNPGDGNRFGDRARELLIELERLSGCCVGWRHVTGRDLLRDVLELRQTCLGDDHAGATDCCGIPGALRVALAAQWYPTRASRFTPAGKRA